MKKINLLWILIFIFFSKQSLGFDQKKEEQLNKISKNLRCLICQGQSVYDSNSEFAESIKLLIKKELANKKKEDEIYDLLKSKYGDWIVYEPEINKFTFLLWVLPLILFIFGGHFFLELSVDFCFDFFLEPFFFTLPLF